MSLLSRRRFLEASLFAGATQLVSSRLALAAAPTEARFVFVLLRGALDGLSAVAPLGDPAYAALRGQIALTRSGGDAALPLDSMFALHPALQFLHASYAAKELIAIHAVATPYRERSHFDGQNVLETGGIRAHDTPSGWLNRAIAAIPGVRPGGGGVALGSNVPLVMRGPVEVASWSPTRIAALDEETLARVSDLYARDPLLSRRLADALESDVIASEAQAAANDSDEGFMERDRKQRSSLAGRLTGTARAAGAFLKREDGPRVAMFDTSGWDTHANEGGARGQLALRLRALDASLAALKDSLGATWKYTVVLVATEFGRTAAINGTRGTDHGTGAAAFLLGGAVAGGRVLADWPGLARGELHEGRDLRATRDLRSVMKGVLRDHLGITPRALDDSVFADSAAVRPIDDSIRTG
jgi:uncharacterized protein (DUF1501 family)